MDTIYLCELRAEANLGVYDWEKRLPQTVEINLEFGMLGPQAGQSDRIGDTIDYAVVAERIREDLLAHRFELLEALAEHVANLLLNDFGSPWVKVDIAKIGMIRNVKRVGVTIERARAG
jgi:7,8-dihydroneopterin aldolase/epimerase/oxygenase